MEPLRFGIFPLAKRLLAREYGGPRQIVWSTDMSQVLVCGFGGLVVTFRWENNRLVHVIALGTTHADFEFLTRWPAAYLCGLRRGAKLIDAETGWVLREFHGIEARSAHWTSIGRGGGVGC